MKVKPVFIVPTLILALALGTSCSQQPAASGLVMDDIVTQSWLDADSNYINAHGGGILFHEGLYYWYGEHRPDKGFSTQEGVNCYSSTDLVHWKHEGIVLPVSDKPGNEIEKGCIIERPKVIYNEKTGKFVLWFHLELKGRGYEAARYGVAVSDKPTGTFKMLRTGRVCPGEYPENLSDTDRNLKQAPADFEEWWTPEWRTAVERGLFTRRDMKDGQMSRDMTLYVDDDGRAYHITSSEENLTLIIAELTDDYLCHTGRYIRIFPGGHNEAPAIFKKDGTYWMITSGCTGWAPNEARMFSAKSIWGPWTQHPNPCRGPEAEKTFGGQSTFVLALPDGRHLFMADRWKPESLMYSGYLWMEIAYDDYGVPVLIRK